GGTFQFGGANLLNSIGNIAYTPNVIDPSGNHTVPPEQPLVMAMWGATDANKPPWAIGGRVYGPFVQISSNPAVVTRFQAPPDQPSARNQLVIAPGVGGGPIVKVYDFIANGNALQQNAFTQFNALADDPALANTRTGLKVSIGNVIDKPISRTVNGVPRIISYVTTPGLGQAGIRFPYSTNYYRQGTAQIIVSQASGGHVARIIGDFNPINPFTGAPSLRTSITQFTPVSVQIGSKTVFDPNNPLNNFQSVVEFQNFEIGVDPQFIGALFSGVSHLPMELNLNNDGRTFTVINDRGANIFAAGPVNSGANRGPKLRIFDHMGPNE